MILDYIQKISNIAASASILIALFTYFYNKRQNNKVIITRDIEFFREKVINEWKDVIKEIRLKDPKYWFSRIEITKDINNIKDIKEKFSRNYENQLSIIYSIENNDSQKWKINGEMLDRQILLLNMLEDFSIRVISFSNKNNKVFDVVKSSFVDIVEKNVVAAYFMKNIISSETNYSNTISLYKHWKKDIKKNNIVNSLEKYGFITKEQKKIILETQRKNTNGK